MAYRCKDSAEWYALEAQREMEETKRDHEKFLQEQRISKYQKMLESCPSETVILLERQLSAIVYEEEVLTRKQKELHDLKLSIEMLLGKLIDDRDQLQQRQQQQQHKRKERS